MNSSKKIIELTKEHNGIITSKIVTKAGISRGSLKYLADNNLIEKTGRGVYILPGVWEDEFVNLQTRYKRGIFSNETALFLHGLTDRTPNKFNMTFPATYNLSNVKKENSIISTQSKEEYYNLGIEEVLTPTGNEVKVYSVEKTLCDLLKPKNSVDIQVKVEAFKRYMRSKDRNIPKLSEYAKILKVENKVRSYLEVLL